MAEILVALPGGEGMIRGDDGELALTDDVTKDGGQPLQPWDRYQTVRLAFVDGRMLFGGLLPPGAVRVEAIEASGVRKPAAVGAGVFAVMFEDGEHGEPALGFRDAAGGFVHRPMPAEYPHRPVLDAEQPCPVCERVEYDEYFPEEEWRAGSGTKGTDSFRASPLIVCRVCGHQEVGGGIIRFRRPDPEEDERAREARLARARAERAVARWHSDKATLSAVTFPVYAAEGWPAHVSGYGSQDQELRSITIAHASSRSDSLTAGAQIEVTTSIEPHQPADLIIARKAFGSRIPADDRERPNDGSSDAAAKLWFRASRRGRIAFAHQAPVGEVVITTDGAPATWLLVGTPGQRWAAVRRHDDLTIIVVAREVDPTMLNLEPVADLTARLLGAEPDNR